MMISPETIEIYLQRTGIISVGEGAARSQYHELVDIEEIEQAALNLSEYYSNSVAKVCEMQSVEDFDQGLYRYSVPRVSEDGFCSMPEIADSKYDLSDSIGTLTLEKLRYLKVLSETIEKIHELTQVEWVGIYRRFDLEGRDPALVKLAYRGIPSRAEFPLTEDFATRSNNSKVGLSGRAVIINNLEVHLRKGGAYYVCDEEVRSEACLPVFDPSFSEIIGIVDAESSRAYKFKIPEVSQLIALCLVLSVQLQQIEI